MSPQHNRLARVARSSNLSFLKPVLEVNTDLAKSSVGHYNELGSSLKTVFILDRIEESWVQSGMRSWSFVRKMIR